MEQLNTCDTIATLIAQIQQSPTQIAALDCSLQGGYLIEASAGTGKTWTLTGIILRLLIEKKYAPERIVATTFTRAAAAEMQERIGGRLQSFYAILRHIKLLQVQHSEWFLSDNLLEKLTNIANSAKQAGLDGDDPINLYLLNKLLSEGVESIDEALRRTANVLTALDKLFVGTLDSLTQKWLKEFAAQIGHQESSELSSDAPDEIAAIVHDKLRQEESLLHRDAPQLFRLVKQSKPQFFGDVPAMVDDIGNALQFFNAEIDTVKGSDIASCNDEIHTLHEQFGVILEQLEQLDTQAMAAYANRDFIKERKISAKGLTAALTKIGSIDALIELIISSEKGVDFADDLSKDEIAFLEKTLSYDDESNFNKGINEADKQAFLSAGWSVLADAYRLSLRNSEIANRYCQGVKRQIAEAVRKQLGGMLESMGRTTFTLQMARLLEALRADAAGETGNRLAQHIRHHYPVALIDESQDINGLQSDLIKLVYLDDLQKHRDLQAKYDEIGGDKPKSYKGFLLLVGDPKQAIYRFRGGDVSNYNNLKYYNEKINNNPSDQANSAANIDNENSKEIISKTTQLSKVNKGLNKEPLLNRTLTLDINRRSNRALIDTLNQWFVPIGEGGQQESVQNPAYLGSQIYYRPISAFRENQRLSWQLSDDDAPNYLSKQTLTVLHFPADDKAYIQKIACHINELLQSSHTIDQRAITASDIAILADKRQTLANMKQALDALNIPAIAAHTQNVFATQAGKDLYALLNVWLNPTNNEWLATLLTSKLFGCTLSQAQQILSDEAEENAQDLSVNHLTNLNNNASDGQDARAEQANDIPLAINRAQLVSYAREGFYKWQRLGLTAALNFAFNEQNHPLASKIGNLWHRAAQLGERYLADLWQLFELVSAHAEMHKGRELQLLSWYEQQAMNDSEENQRHVLPSEAGVQLMTIHRSKGLEFPIVYVLGLGNPTNSKEKQAGLYPYSNANFERRLSPVSDDGDVNFAELVQSEAVEEKRRLGYVALTRASEQLFVVAQDLGAKRDLDSRPLFQWLDNANEPTLSLPERLQGQVGWLDMSQLSLLDTPFAGSEQTRTPRVYQPWDVVMKRQHFDAFAKTSFTALVAKLDKSSAAAQSEASDFDDSGVENIPSLIAAPSVSSDEIRASFIRGIGAGDFLHRVLQFAAADSELGGVVDDWVLRLGLPKIYSSKSADNEQDADVINEQNPPPSEHQKLVQWLQEIYHAPLCSGASPADLPKSAQVRELSFTLGLSDKFSIQRLNAVFEKYSDKSLALLNDKSPNFDHRIIYRYLRGEIDLVYEYLGKFYIVDYKSNFLGADILCYDEATLSEAMDRSGYWLQAAIYQVALHRLLKLRIKNYAGNEQHYLGKVEYLFLRGIYAGQVDFGRIAWQVPLELIFALDEMF